MTEYFRITGLNLIPFDTQAIVGADHRYVLGQSPGGMDEPMTEAEVRAVLPRLPQKIRGHALKRGLSKITFPFTIKGASDPDMEDARHALTETLEAGQLYIETEGARGTRAVLQNKADAAVNQSYKTIVYGEAMELGGRAVLGAAIKQHFLLNLQMVLYCEPYWRPETAIGLGPNEIFCPGFEEDGNADGTADQWTLMNAPLEDTIEHTIVLQGFYSQHIRSNLAGRGIASATMTSPGAPVNDAVAYVWVCRPAAGTDIQAVLRDTSGGGADRAVATYNAATITAVGKDGSEWRRLDLIATNTIAAATTHQVWVLSVGDADTHWYADKAYLKWDTTTIPDEWCDHWLIYNHYDTTESVAHVGHQNYFDVADLKGTDDARLLLRLQFNEDDPSLAGDLVVGRRSWWDYPNFPLTTDVHWLEAENAQARNGWAILGGLATCSAGDCLTDSAAAAGHCWWQFLVDPVGAGRIRSLAMQGRYDVYGMVYTSDEVNTLYRLHYSGFGQQVFYYNNWVRQPDDLEWQMIYLGEVNADRFLSQGVVPSFWQIGVEYQKDAADTVRIDCICLVSKAEPEMRLHRLSPDWVLELGYWAFDRTEDFDYQSKENLGATALVASSAHVLQGDPMTGAIGPPEGQRFYFTYEEVSWAVPGQRYWIAHGAVVTPTMIVTMSYLPQYLSPLD